MHGTDAWDWIWMTPMMFAWIAPIALAVYVAVRLANRQPGDPVDKR